MYNAVLKTTELNVKELKKLVKLKDLLVFAVVDSKCNRAIKLLKYVN